MSDQHTPGPWAWDSRNGNHYLVSCAPNPPHIIVLGWPCGLEDGTWFSDDTYAGRDMALIAAAPDLLAALKELRDVAAAWCRVSMNHPGLAEAFHAAVQQIGIADGFGVRAQAAIAKAEGR